MTLRNYLLFFLFSCLLIKVIFHVATFAFHGFFLVSCLFRFLVRNIAREKRATLTIGLLVELYNKKKVHNNARTVSCYKCMNAMRCVDKIFLFWDYCQIYLWMSVDSNDYNAVVVENFLLEKTDWEKNELPFSSLLYFFNLHCCFL